MLGKLEIYNPESEYLPEFYVDFSKRTRIISFFGVQDEGAHDDESNPLVFVNILNGEVKTSALIATNQPDYHKLTLILRKPLSTLSNTKYRNETVVSMILKTNDIEIVKEVMGDTFEVFKQRISSSMP
jgi:Synaptonemal complex 2 Spt16M-like domain